MALIRKIKIENFRGIKAFSYQASAGINSFIGPGDSGKSSILDAIDFCIGARRNLQITDADFHYLDVDRPIRITITLGALDDTLKSIDTYGLYLGGFDANTGDLSDEPEADLETVLTIELRVESDLEPQWTLVSERAAAQNLSRSLNWADRVRLAPTRIGAYSQHNLSWRRGSILNKISEERIDASTALVKAARDARTAFSDVANGRMEEPLKIVAELASDLGIPLGAEAKAMLDADSVSLSGGTISLHDGNGVPLSGLGLGSIRLLIAGLHRKAATQATIVLVDELEHGLEPHRILRLLDALGAREKVPPLQVFMTTHSPVAVRELSGEQLFVVRSDGEEHFALKVGTAYDVQGTIRRHPEALLAPSVIVCEGASEVGLIRGIDYYRAKLGHPSINSCGVSLVDGGGNGFLQRALAFQSLGYRVAILRDSDVAPNHVEEAKFIATGGKIICWAEGRSLEKELFSSLSEDGVQKLLAAATEIKERSVINDNIKSASDNATDLAAIEAELLIDGISAQSRAIIGKAAGGKKSWFKSVSAMEEIGCEIVGPDLPMATGDFRAKIEELFGWTTDAKR